MCYQHRWIIEQEKNKMSWLKIWSKINIDFPFVLLTVLHIYWKVESLFFFLESLIQNGEGECNLITTVCSHIPTWPLDSKVITLKKPVFITPRTSPIGESAADILTAVCGKDAAASLWTLDFSSNLLSDLDFLCLNYNPSPGIQTDPKEMIMECYVLNATTTPNTHQMHILRPWLPMWWHLKIWPLGGN